MTKKNTINSEKFDELVVAHRRNLHQYAEVGFDLPKTREYITQNLSRIGYEPKTIGNGSIIATIRGDKDEYILLRADMDALPIPEETNLPFKCINGCMHACGHDMHTAMLLTAAEVLQNTSHKKGIIFLFQAAEENLQGANNVIESGALDAYKISFAIAVHVLVGLDYAPGKLVIPPHGLVAPGACVFNFELIGKSSHGSTPHKGVNSIYPAIDIIQAINRMLMVEFAPNDLKFINWGYLHGGLEANIIPEKTVLKGNFRYYDAAVKEKAIKRIKEIAENISKSNNTECEFYINGWCPPLCNNAFILHKIETIININGFDYITPDAIQADKKSSDIGGSEDFAHFAQKYPSALISICAGNSSTGHTHTLHTSKTNFHEDALKSGWRFFVAISENL